MKHHHHQHTEIEHGTVQLIDLRAIIVFVTLSYRNQNCALSRITTLEHPTHRIALCQGPQPWSAVLCQGEKPWSTHRIVLCQGDRPWSTESKPALCQGERAHLENIPVKSNYVLSIIELSSSSSKEIEHKPGVGLLFLTSHRIVILLLTYWNKNWDLEIRNLEEPVNVAYGVRSAQTSPPMAKRYYHIRFQYYWILQQC